MRKIMCLLCVLAVLLLAGCGGPSRQETPSTTQQEVPDTTENVHTHVLTQWETDGWHHWYVCDCGEQAEYGEHTLDDEGICTACGICFVDNGDGSCSILTYDEWGSMNSDTGYDAEGNVIYCFRVESEYDEIGNVLYSAQYYDDVLTSEEVYLPCENPDNGSIYLAESVSYAEDGSKTVYTYNEVSYFTSVLEYDAEGNLVSTTLMEYEFDEEGNCIRQMSRRNDVLILDQVSFVSPQGEVLDSTLKQWDDEGNLESEWIHSYEYDGEGNITYHAIHLNGVIYSEDFYALDAEGCRYHCREISYDENGEVMEDISYDADGNEIE